MKLRIIIFVWLVFYGALSKSQMVPVSQAGAPFNIVDLQSQLKQGIQKAYHASVRCWGYDTVRKAQNSAQFSGVVVSKEGTILTVSHAIQPNRTYKVLFPDGKEVMAVALGKVGDPSMSLRPDLGMMKIITSGNWPFAEMGWSGSLKPDEACFGISYPETLNQLLPTVRFGRIADILNQWGFIQSTCKMEPGDSGGPLFDYMGRVIGMHSRCDTLEDLNYEVPIDMYRKYWTALHEPNDYKTLPAKADEIKTDPLAQKISTIPPANDIHKALSSVAAKFAGATFTLKSKMKDTEQTVLGTAFVADGKTWVLSKSSMVGAAPVLNMMGKNISLTVVARDTANDLVLLRAPLTLKGALPLRALNFNPNMTVNGLGAFLISTVGTTHKTGTLGSTCFSLPQKFSAGYFGAPANFRDSKIMISRIAPQSPAATAKLMTGDQLTAINNVPLTKAEDYGTEMMKYYPGDTINVQVIRAGQPMSVAVILVQRPKGTHPADNFNGGKSIRLDGFDKVFAHDTILKPDECGGPVFDAHGNLYGINIARFSRTTTLALPNEIIKNLIEKNNKRK